MWGAAIPLYACHWFVGWVSLNFLFRVVKRKKINWNHSSGDICAGKLIYVDDEKERLFVLLLARLFIFIISRCFVVSEFTEKELRSPQTGCKWLYLLFDCIMKSRFSRKVCIFLLIIRNNTNRFELNATERVRCPLH